MAKNAKGPRTFANLKEKLCKSFTDQFQKLKSVNFKPVRIKIKPGGAIGTGLTLGLLAKEMVEVFSREST